MSPAILRNLKPLCIVTCLTVLVLFWSLAYGKTAKNPCSETIERWNAAKQELEAKLDQFEKLERTPASNIVGDRVVKRSSPETIAQQVSEALQAKEAVLGKLRDSCRNAVEKQEKAFAAASQCLSAQGSSQRRSLRSLQRNHAGVVKKSLITIAEVKEVRGKEDYAFYYDPNRGGNYPLAGGPDNFWRQQQQMFMNYWRRWGR